jgi:hypothetical protein
MPSINLLWRVLWRIIRITMNIITEPPSKQSNNNVLSLIRQPPFIALSLSIIQAIAETTLISIM